MNISIKIWKLLQFRMAFLYEEWETDERIPFAVRLTIWDKEIINTRIIIGKRFQSLFRPIYLFKPKDGDK